MNHETVELKRSGRTFNIDKGIAPLIELIWKFDLWTLNSCQENRPGIAWIQFAHVQDAETFMALAVDHRGSEKSEDYYNSLYSRIMGERYGHPGRWQYTSHPQDVGVEEEEIDQNLSNVKAIGPPSFQFIMSICFPVTDIPLITKNLKKKLK